MEVARYAGWRLGGRAGRVRVGKVKAQNRGVANLRIGFKRSSHSNNMRTRNRHTGVVVVNRRAGGLRGLRRDERRRVHAELLRWRGRSKTRDVQGSDVSGWTEMRSGPVRVVRRAVEAGGALKTSACLLMTEQGGWTRLSPTPDEPLGADWLAMAGGWDRSGCTRERHKHRASRGGLGHTTEATTRGKGGREK